MSDPKHTQHARLSRVINELTVVKVYRIANWQMTIDLVKSYGELPRKRFYPMLEGLGHVQLKRRKQTKQETLDDTRAVNL